MIALLHLIERAIRPVVIRIFKTEELNIDVPQLGKNKCSLISSELCPNQSKYNYFEPFVRVSSEIYSMYTFWIRDSSDSH